jgi:hypothetical protein
MRTEGTFWRALRITTLLAGDQRTLQAPQPSAALANPKPQNPRRPTLGKKSKAFERHVERSLGDRTCKCVARAAFQVGIGVAEKVEGQVHALRMHP